MSLKTSLSMHRKPTYRYLRRILCCGAVFYSEAVAGRLW